ncbi:hypothetical protein KBP30_40880 [Streptomyces sp. Go40/10]|uniref:DUF7380 domain-containing protein n=1 Tax=Streptomyces sp. Go40/10 TaxID=2825844 RepID=UPI001E53DE6D|nr:hypothetical protein [Streptomyces sp. Go40/10]UFR07105.1 hypothetical protein KBP30_40880 [Streptomyces sp. Go40/10]
MADATLPILVFQEVQMGIDPTVLAWIDQTAAEFASLQELLQRWIERANAEAWQGQAAAEADALWAALCFHATERGGLAGDFIGRSAERWPANPQAVADSVVETWAGYAEAVGHPMLRARLHHLVWEARKRFPHARKAIENYTEAVPRFLSMADRSAGRCRASDCLGFAYELAVRLSARDLELTAKQAMISFVRELLDDSQEAAPGLVLEILRKLVGRHASDAAVQALLSRATSIHGGDVPVVVELLQLRIAGTQDQQERAALQRQIVEELLTDAERFPGFIRVDRLNAAAIAARDYGLEGLFDDARVRMQAIAPDQLGMESFHFEFPVRRAEIEDYSRKVLGQAQTLGQAFSALASLPAPSGTREAAQEHARSLASKGLLSSFIPSIRINAAGPVPVAEARVRTAADDESEWHVTAMMVTSVYVHHLLETVRDRFDPTTAQLAQLFTADPIITGIRAAKLAHAFRYYWSGEYDAALAIALPRIEGILRETLRYHRIPIVQPPQGDSRGRVTLLTTLIDRMTDADMHADWQAFLRLLLVDSDGGLNLRNSELHDLSDTETAPQTVALVLLAALHVTAHAHQAAAPADGI